MSARLLGSPLPETAAPMTLKPEWPVAFFDDDYLRIYRPQFQPERTATETRFIASALGVASGAEVLDLACGFGRHTIGMAERGYRMTGLDFNPRYLEIAAADAKAAGVEVTWRTGDMRALGVARGFDAIYSYFTSFGYFDDDDNDRVLAEVACALRPGGRFLLEMMNRDHLIAQPQQRTWTQREDGALLMEETSLDPITSRVVSRQVLIDPQGGSQVTKEYSLRAYTCAELSALLRRHALDVTSVAGGAEGEAYGPESRRLAIIAERRA